MTTTTAAFRWLDLLEKEFDKSYVDLNLIFHDMIDSDQEDLYEIAKDKLSDLSHSWSQLVHKTQTIFQINCKLEVLLIQKTLKI